MRQIELLAPARNAEYGIEAIRCGADAVYIGAQALGARADATNSTEDIKKLVEFAHLYGAKVYIALNTIIYEHELQKARQLIENLAEAGVDALITQDMALAQMDLPLPLHASTQMNNCDAIQVKHLKDNGYERAILARELSLKQINAIHNLCPDMELEVFVHGALCVSYSGRCYASQHCFGRSANRGECAQFCRLAFNLEDADGNILFEDKHLLSLRDMNRSEHLEELMDAGVCSFKIEGRLKDLTYVKNVTAFYRQKIDQVIQHKEGYERSSYGSSHIDFTPSLQKSFNRGFTNYFLHGRTKDVFSFNTPKAIGEPVGEVKEIKGKSIKVTGVSAFCNGDGLCFFDSQKKLQGFRINRVDNNILYPGEMPKGLLPHTKLYRNHDEAFFKEITHSQVKRTLAVDILLKETENGFSLSMTDERKRNATIEFDCKKELARSPQKERQQSELAKLGGTIFETTSIMIDYSQDFFIPASTLSDWRRRVLQKLTDTSSADKYVRKTHSRPSNCAKFFEGETIPYYYNVANSIAKEYYEQQGAILVDKAYELEAPQNAVIMTCKHCLRYAMGFCKKEKHNYKDPLKEPLFLTLPNGKRFSLHFDCHNCQMKIYATQ